MGSETGLVLPATLEELRARHKAEPILVSAKRDLEYFLEKIRLSPETLSQDFLTRLSLEATASRMTDTVQAVDQPMWDAFNGRQQGG